MQTKTQLFLTLASVTFVSFIADPVFAQDDFWPLPYTAAEDDADSEDENTTSRPRDSKLPAMPRVTADGTRLPNTAGSLSFGLVAASEMEQLVVEGSEVPLVTYPALPEVEGARINSGKKTSLVRPEEFPAIVNNNFRQALATTPGLLVSEEPTSPIINIGYRGLDSQRTELSQVLQDGISIKNEQFGFPETHYTPPLDALERIEVIRGGAALQFGPQPGGAINFVTRLPRTDAPFHFTTKNVYGSDDLFTSYTAVDGTSGPLGYLGYYNHREREGFREANGDFRLDSGSAKLVYDLSPDQRFVFTFDAYDEEHGEPGGLTAIPGPGAFLYSDDRNATTRFFDRFQLRRYYATLGYEYDLSERTLVTAKAFGGYLSRFSKRQRGGGFGTLPTGPDANTNSIQLREDYTQGAEMRLRHDYDLFGSTSTFTGGLYFYHGLQDRRDERGAAPDAENGVLRNFNTGETYDGAIFAENRFVFGRLSVVPGMRLEHIGQSLNESVNVAKTGNGDPLASRSDFSFVPLFGLGLSYVAVPGDETVTAATAAEWKNVAKEMRTTTSTSTTKSPRLEFYGNVSQAYRPRTYGELVPTGPNSFVNGDLEEGHSLQGELGLRGKPLPFLTFDMSGFYYTFEDQVGDTSIPGGFSSTGNVGDARYVGAEAGFELDLLALANGGVESPYGELALFGNVTYLDAKFTSGPLEGKTPSYAPDYQIKAGVLYRWQKWLKAGLTGVAVDNSFADANNSAERFIPNYTTWDLTVEAKFFKNRVGVIAGINNLFDEDFYGEIRDEGIVPAYRRNFYGGLSFEF